MRVDVQLFDDLDAVAADAAGALDRAAQAALFDRLAWYRLVWTHARPPGRLLVARARDSHGTAWLFLTRDRGHAHALASWYTLRFAAPVIGDATACLPAIARALSRHRPAIARLTLGPLDAPAAAALRAAFAQAGWHVRTAETTVNWSVAPGTDWAAYLAARPGQLRATLRRKARDHPLAIVIHTRFDPDAWAAYEAVYRASWKPAEGSWPFLRALAEQEGAAGTLRLGIARAGDGTPVAAQLWLTENGTATIHKLAHVEAAKATSAGTLLGAAMFRHAIDVDRVARIDFGTGDDPYKADWMDVRTPLLALDAWNVAHPRGAAALASAAARALVRRIAKV